MTTHKIISKGQTITIEKTLVEAVGRGIVVGESHTDRTGLKTVLELMRAAHEVGYRTLGVEVSIEGVRLGKKRLWGLKDELCFLRLTGYKKLSQYDKYSYLEPDHTGKSPRMNRHWHMQLALSLGWNIIAIDPHHFNWRSGTADGYFYSRDTAIAKSIREYGQMISVVGFAHLKGLHDIIGESVVYVNSFHLNFREDATYETRDGSMDALYPELIKFTTNIPFLLSLVEPTDAVR